MRRSITAPAHHSADCLCAPRAAEASKERPFVIAEAAQGPGHPLGRGEGAHRRRRAFCKAAGSTARRPGHIQMGGAATWVVTWLRRHMSPVFLRSDLCPNLVDFACLTRGSFGKDHRVAQQCSANTAALYRAVHAPKHVASRNRRGRPPRRFEQILSRRGGPNGGVPQEGSWPRSPRADRGM